MHGSNFVHLISVHMNDVRVRVASGLDSVILSTIGVQLFRWFTLRLTYFAVANVSSHLPPPFDTPTALTFHLSPMLSTLCLWFVLLQTGTDLRRDLAQSRHFSRQGYRAATAAAAAWRGAHQGERAREPGRAVRERGGWRQLSSARRRQDQRDAHHHILRKCRAAAGWSTVHEYEQQELGFFNSKLVHQLWLNCSLIRPISNNWTRTYTCHNQIEKKLIQWLLQKRYKQKMPPLKAVIQQHASPRYNTKWTARLVQIQCLLLSLLLYWINQHIYNSYDINCQSYA